VHGGSVPHNGGYLMSTGQSFVQDTPANPAGRTEHSYFQEASRRAEIVAN
jgi:hypothetical protein